MLRNRLNQFDISTPRRDFLRAVATGTLLATTAPLLAKFNNLTPKQSEEFKAMFSLPNTPETAKWDFSQKREYVTQAFQDYYFIGPKALTARKWWYENIRGLALPQQHQISCEFTALQFLLLGKGIKTLNSGLPVTEDNLISIVPISDNPMEGRPENMDAEWGNIPPNPYGVNPRTLAMYIKQNTNSDLVVYDFTSTPTVNTKKHYLDNLERLLPCAVWFQMNTSMGESSYYPYKDVGGTIVAPGEHCAIALAMDDNRKNLLLGNTDLEIYRAEMDGPNGFFERSKAVGMGIIA